MGIGAAAAITTGVVLAAFPGGPVGGWLAERTGARRELAAVFTVLSAGCVAAIPFAPVALLDPDLIALGFFDGVVFSILYLIPTYFPESRGEGLALGVGVVNSIQVSLGSAVAVAFGVLAASEGYAVAWSSRPFSQSRSCRCSPTCRSRNGRRSTTVTRFVGRPSTVPGVSTIGPSGRRFSSRATVSYASGSAAAA